MGMLNPLVSSSFTVPQTTATGPASDGASAAIDISDLDTPYVLLVYPATVTGTYKVQVSNDGTNWFDVGADVTASTNRSLAANYSQARVKCTVNTANGSVSATVAGRRVYRQS